NSPRATCLDGKSKVLTYVPNFVPGNAKGRYKVYTMDGIYRRFNSGEKIKIPTVNNKTGQIEEANIIKVARYEKLDRLKIKTKSGAEIICTPDHYIAFDYDEGGVRYCKAEELEIGESLIRKNKSSDSINSDNWMVPDS